MEKALKALLLKNGKVLRKIHDLVMLGREADLPADLIEHCDKLNPVYLESRYPDTGEDIPYERYTKEESEKDIKIAEEILKWIKNRLL